MLKRVARHLGKQEKKGKQTQFLLEPLLAKETDFSCQFKIDPTGKLEIVSVQVMRNAGFAFAGIATADAYFYQQLTNAGYFAQVEAIATALFQEGYHGPVCLDSMTLTDGSIVPVVEINARKSMGLVNHFVDQYLRRFDMQGSVRFFSLGLRAELPFEQLLGGMAEAGSRHWSKFL